MPVNVRSSIVAQLDGDGIYVYGAAEDDAVLEGPVTALISRGGRQHWIRIEIQEFDPAQETALTLDYEVLGALARRAGVPSPRFSW